MNKIDVITAWHNIFVNGKYPNYGSMETTCEKCMFHNITCKPKNENTVGCYSGWKEEPSFKSNKVYEPWKVRS